MIRFLLIILLFSTSIAHAVDKPPSLGNCSEYTDYYIYKCQKFKCKLPVAKMTKTFLEMEVVEDAKQGCIYNYQYNIRNPQYPPTEIRMKCTLSEEGKLEMANQFTAYKKGNVGIYIDPPFNEVLAKECNRY